MNVVEISLPTIGIGGIDWRDVAPSTPKPPVVETPETTIIRLNQTISNPYSMLSGEFGKDGTPETNVISWIRANSHRYVGNYSEEQGMVLRQLDDNNSELYADGSDAFQDIKGVNGGDVFMKMPNFWFKGVEVDGNPDIVDMHFSAQEPTDEGWTKWDGNTLIGAYKTVAENTDNNTTGGLFSRSGVTPSVSVLQANFKAKARNRSNGDDHFQIITYEAHQVMALLYMAWYGNTNSQVQCGEGNASYPKVTGQTNEDGMNDTIAENTRSINFWGLENWWDDIVEWMDNLGISDNSVNVSIKDYDGNTIRKIETIPDYNFIDKLYLAEKLDVIATSFNGNSNTYYCDKERFTTNLDAVGRRSGSKKENQNGVFLLFVDSTPNSGNNYHGSRLLYHGRVTISNTPLRTRSIASPWKPIDLQYVYRDGKPVLRTGFDFNICNVSSLQEVGKLSLYGLNINYDKIEFESNAAYSDTKGNITFNTDGMPSSIDMNYKGQLIGTLKFYDISEEELIQRQRYTNPDKFNEYNDFCEECKVKAKEEVGWVSSDE